MFFVVVCVGAVVEDNYWILLVVLRLWCCCLWLMPFFCRDSAPGNTTVLPGEMFRWWMEFLLELHSFKKCIALALAKKCQLNILYFVRPRPSDCNISLNFENFFDLQSRCSKNLSTNRFVTRHTIHKVGKNVQNNEREKVKLMQEY